MTHRIAAPLSDVILFPAPTRKRHCWGSSGNVEPSSRTCDSDSECVAFSSRSSSEHVVSIEKPAWRCAAELPLQEEKSRPAPGNLLLLSATHLARSSPSINRKVLTFRTFPRCLFTFCNEGNVISLEGNLAPAGASDGGEKKKPLVPAND